MPAPKKPAILLSADEFAQVTAPEDAGTALRGDWQAGTTGFAGQVAERERLLQQAPLTAAIQDQARSTSDIWQAGLQNTDTAWMLRGALEDREELFVQPDPNFDILRDYQEILQEWNIQDNDTNLAALSESASAQDAHYLASRIAEKEQRESVLGQHGLVAFSTAVVDPAALVADWATFGAAKTFKLGRIASGVLGGSAALSVSTLADIAGKDYEALDHTINFAVTGGVFALLGGKGLQGLRPAASTAAPGAPAPSGLRQGLTNFLSETDKIVGHGNGAVDVMRPVLDDPVRRADLLTNNNAASFLRVNSNILDGHFAKWTDKIGAAVGAREGIGTFSRMFDFSGKYGAARDLLEREVAEELARRDSEFTRFGQVADIRIDPDIKRLADDYESMMTAGAEMAKRQGLHGFEEFTPRQGYFHRSWSEAKIRQLEDQYSRKAVKGLVSKSIEAGLRLTKKESDLIATAILTRTRSKAAGLRPEFMGSLGKTDSDAIREMLEEAKVDAATTKSIMGRIEQNLDEAGKSKYSKTRLPLDMTVRVVMPDGRTVSMLDLIDTDLSRLAENYTQQMAGRSALAAAGVGGDDASVQALRQKYRATMDNAKLSDAQIEDRMLQFDYLMGDFTGNRPAQALMGPVAMRAKSLAHSTMLAASGLWQVAETGTMAFRYGAAQTTGEFFKQFPGVAGLLRKAGRDPDLYDELNTVVGLDLARDVRVRPWLRQYEMNTAKQDSLLDRVLFLGNQATPILNAMKFVHKHQTRMNANLALNTMVRAAGGDKRARQMLREYGLDGAEWGHVKQAIQANASIKGKNAQAMNWDGWPQDAVDSALNAATRIMDDAVLFGRAGQGASFSRSALGQMLGQFRSFVSFAHNKLLRGTIQNQGYTGLATLLAYQYPLTLMMVGVNELRKGEAVDLSSPEGLADLAQKGIGYTAGLGFIGDAAGIVGLTGGRGGLSAPVLGLANAPLSVARGTEKLIEGESAEGIADYMQAARTALPFIGVMPGTALLQNALKE